MKLKNGILLILYMGLLLNSQAQNDSVLLNPLMGISDGIYLSYYDFRHAQAIHKNDINSKLDTTQIDFLSKALANEKFQFNKGGQYTTMECKKVWGYFQNNTLHIFYNDGFYRVPVFGAISYLVALVKVVIPGYYDARFGYQTGNTTSTEMKEFVMSFYDGSVEEFTLQKAENLMATDKFFYEEVKKLNTRKRKKQIYSLIRRFNELHPVYVLR